MRDAHRTSTRNRTRGHLSDALERRLLLAAADLDPRFDANGLRTTEFPAFSHWVDAIR
jgi:hypothetical protein